MTGRMESVENLVRQRERFAPQRQIFHPSHRPLEIAGAIPTFPQPDDDSLLQTYKPQNQGDTSTGLTQGTFLLGLDKKRRRSGARGPLGCTLFPGARRKRRGNQTTTGRRECDF